MTTRFGLDGPRAHAALTRHQRREKWRPEIPADWCAAFDPDGNEVAALVHGAINHNVITCPPVTLVTFTYENGVGGDDYYQWEVAVEGPLWKVISTWPAPMSRLGSGDASGVRGPDDAMAVLVQAVAAGNELLDCLAAGKVTR